MGTLTEMPTIQNLDSGRKERVLASYRCMQQCVVKESKTSMERGWEAAQIERDNGWEIIGFKHQHDCRVSLGVSYANWYRTMSVAQNFAELSKAEFLAMKLENAELLGRQSTEIRYNPQNIEAAGTETINIFKTKFTPLPAQEKEHWSTMELRMRKEQKEVVEKGIREFQSEHGIENPAYALELMVVETSERPTLVGFLHSAIHDLGEAIREAKDDAEKLAMILRDHIKAMEEIVHTCCGEVEEVTE